MRNFDLTEWEQVFNRIENSKPDQWQTLKVVYELPFVERLWMPFGPVMRINLHRIFPHEPISLWHPHPWPANFLVLDNCYMMDFGTKTDVHATFKMIPGSKYSILNPQTWHNVRTIGDAPSYSIMVSGEPFDSDSDYVKAQNDGTLKKAGPQPHLDDEVRNEMLVQFKLLVGHRSKRRFR